MLKSNKIMYCLLALAILVLIIGSNSANAASLDENNQTDSFEQRHANNEANIDKIEEKNIVDKTKTKNIIKTNDKKRSKGDNELKDITLTVENIECDYGNVADINVVTTPEVDEGVLSFYINERLVGAKNLSNSAASYSLRTDSYVPGTYELLVSYSASLNYANNQTTSTLKINKVESEIKNINMHFNSENNIVVNLNIVGKNQEDLDFGTLNVYDDKEKIASIEIEDYDVEFTLDKKYNEEVLRLEYIGDEYYSDALLNKLIYVEKSNLNIYLPYLSAYKSSIINQSLTFYSEKLVNDGRINVYVDEVFVDQIEVSDENVDVVIDTNNYLSGNYSVYIEYVDSDVYTDSFYQTTLNIKEIATTTYTYNITAHKNQIINLRAYVYNHIDETNDGIIEFLLDDESIKTVILNNNTVMENYLIPDSIEYGEHNIKVLYYGSQKYENSHADAILTIIKYSNSLSLKNYTLNDEGNIVLNIRTYSYNNTVDDGELELYVNGTLISTTSVTGNNTMITLPEEYTADNEYNIELKYKNSDKYDDANLSINLTPEKYNTSTRISNSINNENVLNITSYVYSTGYSDINEGIIKFYINDTLIATVNVENNQANILYDMKDMEEKEYLLKTEYIGTRLYRNSENSTNINFHMNRKTIYITTNNTIKTTPGRLIQINAGLNDYNGNPINLTTNATIKILNESITLEFVEGKLNYEYNLDQKTPEGTSNITIEIPQSRYYKNATRTIKLTVTKDSPYITAPNTIRSNKYETITLNATLTLNKETIHENITGIVKINNKTVYQGKFINGYMEYKLTLNEKYTNDYYNITIKSQETPYYHQAEKTITLNLNSRNTYITSQNILSKNGEKIIIEARIFDRITRDYVKGTSKACIKINEVTLENLNVTNGHLVYAYINDYSAKDYNITIIYGENGIYNSSRWDGKLTIKASPLNIVTNNINAPAYSVINIKAKVLDANKIATGIIKTAIKINNKTIIEENITNGKIDFNYQLSDNIGSGKYNLTIIVGDSRRYIHNTTTVDLIITRNYKHIETSNITAKRNGTIRIQAKILDQENRLINKTTKVNIKIGGKSITDLNVSDGRIDYEYKLPENLNKGLYDLLIQAGENSGYYHATTNSILKVE